MSVLLILCLPLFFWLTDFVDIQKTFKIITKVDSDSTDYFMGLNNNDQEPGGINKNTNVTDDQEPNKISQTPI